MCVDIGLELLQIICQLYKNKACPIVSVFSFLIFILPLSYSAKFNFADNLPTIGIIKSISLHCLHF